MMSSDSDANQNTGSLHAGNYERYRIRPGTNIAEIENLDFLIKLMAGVETLRSSARWLKHASRDQTRVGRGDLWIAAITGAGWCAEVIRLVKQGTKKGILDREMIADNPEFTKLLDSITSNNPPTLIGKVHRIRDNYFAHWDTQESHIIKNFIASQEGKTFTEPFFESDAAGKFFNTRYLWPSAAFALDLVGNIEEPEKAEEMRSLFHDLGELWAKTMNLIAQLLCRSLEKSAVEFEPVPDDE